MELCKKALKINPNDWVAHRELILIYSYLNRLEEARAQASELIRIRPNFTLKQPMGPMYKDKERVKQALELFRKAGIPEG